MTVASRFDVEWCCWAASGWEDAGEGSVRDARTTTRGQAAAFYSTEATGDICDVRVWKRYIRPFTRDEIWAGPGRDRWVDRRQATTRCTFSQAIAGCPESPPEGWQPDEYDPSWGFVHRSHPEAIPVWVCGFKGDEPPENPSRPGVVQGEKSQAPASGQERPS
jgi:hypothetical protein